MSIRWNQIQNLTVTEDEINLLTGLTANAGDLNALSGFTGTVTDLNDLLGTDADLAAHEALDSATAHPIAAGSLDGLLITDGTLTEAKMAFNVAVDTDIADLQVQIDDVVSDTAVQQTQIDNLFAIVIPGQGDDLADAIQQTIDHIEKVSNAHSAAAISYGDYYTLPSDIVAATTVSLTMPASIIKFFRAGESIRFKDDITPTEDVVLTTVNYTTNEITFPVTGNGYTTANNGIIWTLAEDQTQEALNRSFRNDGETQMILREGVYTGTLDTQILTADRNWILRDEDLILGNPAITGNALNVLRVNAGATDVEWHDLTAADIDFDNTTSGLAAVEVQEALDEIDGNIDTHIADLANPHDVTFTQAVAADAGTDITPAEAETLTDGSNADLLHDHNHQDITGAGSNTHATIDSHIGDNTIHRSINDAGSAVTDLWSANKIITELATKSDSAHTHGIDDLTDVDTTSSTPSPGEHLEWDGANWIPGTSGEVNTASNLGAGNGVFNSKVGLDLQFKSLIAGTNITLTPSGTDITINAAAGVGEANTVSNVGGANGIFKQKTGIDLEFKTLAAGANMTITPVGDTLSIASTASGGGGGTSIDRTQATHGFSVLDTIYHNGTIWVRAQADDPDTLGEYVVSVVTDVNNFTANKFGEITVAAHGKTIGEHYFLSATVAGGSDINEPDDFSCPVFYAEDANTIHVEVYRPSEITEVVSELTKYQTKTTSAAVSTTGVISALTFNNLEIGKTYRISGMLRVWVTGSVQAGNNQAMIHVKNGTTVLTRMNVADWTSAIEGTLPCTTIFVASNSTLTVDVITLLQSNERLDGYMHLEELPFHQLTAQWT